jgi:phenylpropionate dioxygenase-like ring-hydroxylating dioxygenase large terminal subunit
MSLTDTSSATERSERREPGLQDWSSWPIYDGAKTGFRNYWYPVMWANQLTTDPEQVTLCGQKIMVMRDVDGSVHALHDRCPHRGVPLSQGDQQFPGTVSCAYHGWTYGLADGELKAVITDGPDSPICGKVNIDPYPIEERLGLIWVFVGDRAPHPLDDQLPEELVAGPPPLTLGGRIDPRTGNWRLACENGFDEGHAKYLHRTSLWRLFKTMPTWNMTHIVREGRWLFRVQDEVHWEATFPGLGTWTNKRWWKLNPPETKDFTLGNTGAGAEPDPYIQSQGYPGFVSVSQPGVLRVAYPQFIHYEFYVPVDKDNHLYVGFMVQFKTGLAGLWYRMRYLGGIRWLFHGNFSHQDKWMVEQTDAPPERLYRPDQSLTAWRRLAIEPNPFDPPIAAGEESADVLAEEVAVASDDGEATRGA